MEKITKEEKIIHGTNLIIKFMELETFKHYEQVCYKEMQPDHFDIDVMGLDITASEFHLSWDWIMQVYKKVHSDFKLLEEKVKSSKFYDNKLKFLKRIEDIDCAIRCEIWGVRIWETYLGIIEAIIFINLYENIDTDKLNF